MRNILLFFFLITCAVCSSQSVNKSKSKTSKKKQSTGWEYNDTLFGDFKRMKFEEQETPSGCILIEGGIFFMGNQSKGYQLNQSDSLFIKHNNGARVSVSSFYLLDHEVTNMEYSKYVDWFKTRKAMDILAEHHPEFRLQNGQYNEEIPIDWLHPTLIKYFYLPNKTDKGEYRVDPKQVYYVLLDTTCFQREYDYKSNAGSPDFLLWGNIDSMSTYFIDPVYKNYPVVGVSFIQANDYCKWLSDQKNQAILLKHKKLKSYSFYFTTESYLKNNEKALVLGLLQPNFRLPTEAEWEYTAVYKDYVDEQGSYPTNINNFYPWKGPTFKDKKGNYLANFGRIYDQNKILMKKLNDDGFLFTAPVKSYAPNQKKIYDMAGNVSEWVLDSRENIGVYSNLMLENPNLAFKFAYNQLKTKFLGLDTNYQSGIDQVNEYLSERISYENHLKNNSPARVVKGGSWAESPIYLMPGTSSFYHENSSSARIGFRVAMDRVGSPFPPKKRRKRG